MSFVQRMQSLSVTLAVDWWMAQLTSSRSPEVEDVFLKPEKTGAPNLLLNCLPVKVTLLCY